MSTALVTVDKNLVRGDDRELDLFVTEPAATLAEELNPTPVSLDGARVTFTVKRLRANGRSVHADVVVLRKTSDDTLEIELSDQNLPETVGRAVIHLTAADTKFLEPGVYGYDVQVLTALNKTHTVARGRLYLLGDITAAEDGTVP